MPSVQVLKERQEGPAAPLKRFHNEIKRRLIYRYCLYISMLTGVLQLLSTAACSSAGLDGAWQGKVSTAAFTTAPLLLCRFGYQAEALIDYACGRGGDLNKWDAARVSTFAGLAMSSIWQGQPAAPVVQQQSI